MTIPDDELDRVVDTVREVYNAPGETPREEMWRAIAPGLGVSDTEVVDLSAARAKRGWLGIRYSGWAAAAAAVLAMGIGIGRMTAPLAPPESMANTVQPGPTARGIDYAAVEHMGRAESMLTMVRSDARGGVIDDATGRWARQLLAETRLLLDVRGDDDEQVKELLEDVELVLVQLVGAVERGPSNVARSRTELDLALQGLEDREVISRLRAAGPQLGLSGS